MSKATRLVGATQFEKETGATRQTFYNILRQMVQVGVAAKTQKKIDMNCDWMKTYVARSVKIQSFMANGRDAEDIEPSDPDDEPDYIPQLVAQSRSGDADRPELTEVLYEKELETVNKLKIDNAVKSKRVISIKIVSSMVEKIDDALNKIIMDGEASFVPQMIQKVHAGAPEEEIKKFWRSEVGKIIKPVKPYLKRALKKAMEFKP